ncbi:MAG: hypothetical protein KAQ85_00910 [Thermodesulfovibrionia bacterium]|nr:hypothetical protein [Thermodesulfovibrionia bacterium]
MERIEKFEDLVFKERRVFDILFTKAIHDTRYGELNVLLCDDGTYEMYVMPNNPKYPEPASNMSKETVSKWLFRFNKLFEGKINANS